MTNMNKYIDAEKLIAEIERWRDKAKENYNENIYSMGRCDALAEFRNHMISLQELQSDERPEYGYLYTEYIHGKKPRWSIGDVLAYYISTSNEEGEYLLGKIVNVEFDEEDGWIYTFEDESAWDEQSLVEEEAYKKNQNGK